MNCRTKSKGHPSFATAPAEGVPVVLQCAPALPPAGQDAGCAQSPLPISSKATVSGGRGRTCSCCAAAATCLLWRTCRRDGQRYLATKYLHSLADGEKGLRKAIVLLRENMAAKNQAALRKLEGAGNGAGGDAYTDAAAGSNRRPVPNAGQQREVTPIADETH